MKTPDFASYSAMQINLKKDFYCFLRLGLVCFVLQGFDT